MQSEARDWIIYGATGFTGRAIAEAAVARGLRPRLCGRDRERVMQLAAQLGVEGRTAALDHPDELRDAAEGCGVVLNAAGPFSRTTAPWIATCLERSIHYLDVSGEVNAIRSVVDAHPTARAREIMLMPAVGFDVVASDCLGLHALGRMPDARVLRIGFAGLGAPSRGSARTVIQEAQLPIRVRREGRLCGVAPGMLAHTFDFGRGPSRALAVSWGDTITAHYTTGLANIETYIEATPTVRLALAMQPLSRFLWGQLADELLAAGISQIPQGVTQPVVVAELERADGTRVYSRLTTPGVYEVTVQTSLGIVERVLAGDFEPGFQTPARVYGADFVLALPGVTRMDL